MGSPTCTSASRRSNNSLDKRNGGARACVVPKPLYPQTYVKSRHMRDTRFNPYLDFLKFVLPSNYQMNTQNNVSKGNERG